MTNNQKCVIIIIVNEREVKIMYTIKVGVEVVGTKETYKEAMKFASNYHFAKVYDANEKLVAIYSKPGVEK